MRRTLTLSLLSAALVVLPVGLTGSSALAKPRAAAAKVDPALSAAVADPRRDKDRVETRTATRPRCSASSRSSRP